MSERLGSKLVPWHVDAAGVCVLAMIGVAGYMLLAEPLLARRAQAQSQAVELSTKREQLARTRAARQDAEARLAEVRAAVDKQSVRLEPRSAVNKRLDALTRLAEEAGIGVERLAPGATADGPRHGTMTLKLTGKASYRACEAFVASLHRAFNDTAITTLRMAAAPGPDEPVTLEVELLWFTAPDVKVPGH